MFFENGRLRIVGTGGALRIGSSSLGALVLPMYEPDDRGVGGAA